MISQQQIDGIKNLISKLEQMEEYPFIKSILIGGSSCLPWIKINHDIDLVFFSEPMAKGKRNELARKLFYLREDEKVQPFVVLVGRFKNDLPIESYFSKFNIMLLGDIKDVWYDTDIIGKDQKRYVEACAEYMQMYVELYRPKRLYHVLTGLYMINNNKYELTDEQIINVNIAHDRADGYEELWKWAEEEIRNKICSMNA